MRRKGDLLRQFYFTQMEENWKDILDFEGYYQISDLGRVKSLAKTITRKNGVKVFMPEKILKPTKANPGYFSLILCKENCRKTVRVHRLIAQAFIDNPKNKPEVNHINGIKTDNRIENLEWVTCSENIKHAFDTGLNKPQDVRGVKNGRCKLSEKQVLEIRESKLSNKDLSKSYNVSDVLIGQIKNKKIWTHI